MSKLYNALYVLAKSDFKAANILVQSELYMQGIYFYAQTFEKATKAIISFYLMNYENKSESVTATYLKNTYGHKFIELTITIIKIFLDKEKELYISKGGKESDDFIQKAYRSLNGLKQQNYNEDELIVCFNHIVKHNYNKFYRRMKEEQPFTDTDPGWEYLRKQLTTPTTKFLTYGTLAWILSPILEKMDMYTRYPIAHLENNNMKFLADHKNKEACLLLSEMIGDLITLVPIVWKKLESLIH